MKKEIFKNNYLYYQKGMTLIELLVTLSIFMVVTGVTVFDYGSFRSNVSVQNLASDITLAIRKAQSYAIGSYSISNTSRDGYGVHFTTNTDSSNPLSGSNKSFVLFVDKDDPRDGLYTIPSASSACNGVDTECQEVLNITSSDRINGIYLENSPSPLPNSTDSLDITFVRPNPDAIFCYRPMNDPNNCSGHYSYVKIKVWNGLSGDSSKIKTIIVRNTGQISVQ